MGLLRGTATYTRYKVAGPVDLAAAFEGPVLRALFTPIDDTADEYSAGWVRPDDHLSTEVSLAACMQEPFVILALREDRRRLKGPVLKKELRQALAKWREENPDTPLNRHRREEIKDRVRLGLLLRLPAEPGAVELAWNTQTGEVLVASHSARVLELVEAKFKDSFGAVLVPRVPVLLGLDLLAGDAGSQALLQAFFGVQPFMFPDHPPVSTLADPSAELLSEFMLWLWLRADQGGGLDIKRLGKASIALGADLSLAPRGGGGVSLTLRAAKEETLEDAGLGEAFEALDTGRRPTAASFTLETEGLKINLGLRHRAAGPANLSLPPIEAGHGSDWWGAALERLYLIQRAHELLDGLLYVWLLALTAGPAEAEAMRQQVIGWINRRVGREA